MFYVTGSGLELVQNHISYLIEPRDRNQMIVDRMIINSFRIRTVRLMAITVCSGTLMVQVLKGRLLILLPGAPNEDCLARRKLNVCHVVGQ